MTVVSAVMSDHSPVCYSGSDWSVAANVLWETDAGIVVVLDAEQHPIGIISERDICRTVAMRDSLPETLKTADVMWAPAPSCHPNEGVSAALATMALNRIPALPVLGPDGEMIGIVSIQRILLGAAEDPAIAPAQLLQVLREVWARRQLPEAAVVCGWEHR